MKTDKRRADGSLTPEQVIDLQQLRSHLEKLNKELKDLVLPERSQDISSLPADESSEAKAEKQYAEALQKLSLDVEVLYSTAVCTVKDIADILNAVSVLNNAQVWDNIPSEEQAAMHMRQKAVDAVWAALNPDDAY